MRKGVVTLLGAGLLFLAVASIMYQSTLAYLTGKWGMDDFTYAYFIPPVVAYLVWEKRPELGRETACKSWAGLVPALLGILFYWAGELGGEYTIMFISCWLLCVGALWSLVGWRVLRVVAFPVCLLLAMVPPPIGLYNGLTLRLKLVSTELGVGMLQSYGMTAYREGNVIDLGFTRLQVVDACSGLRYFFPLIILGLLMAYFFKGAWWKKALLVLSAIPISIVTNSMRIASVGILYQYLGPAAAEGFFHDFSGWFIFMISMGILVLEQALLRRLPPRAAAPAAGAAGGDPEAAPDRERPGSATCAGVRLLTPQFLIVLLLMGTTAWGAQGVTTRNRTPLARPFSAFPGEIGSWSGKRQQMEQIYLDGLELNDYLLADYRNPAGDLINCYVAFNDYQSKGKSSHSPESCLPGSGWELRNPQLVTLTDRTGRSLRVNRALMVMGEDRRVTYYWFDQRGRILTDMYRIKLYNVLDSITLNRTDGALVRLVTPLRQGEPAAAADARLKEFFREFNPALRSFLPPGARS